MTSPITNQYFIHSDTYINNQIKWDNKFSSSKNIEMLHKVFFTNKLYIAANFQV